MRLNLYLTGALVAYGVTAVNLGPINNSLEDSFAAQSLPQTQAEWNWFENLFNQHKKKEEEKKEKTLPPPQKSKCNPGPKPEGCSTCSGNKTKM